MSSVFGGKSIFFEICKDLRKGAFCKTSKTLRSKDCSICIFTSRIRKQTSPVMTENFYSIFDCNKISTFMISDLSFDFDNLPN